MFFDANNNPTSFTWVIAAGVAGLLIGFATYGGSSNTSKGKKSKPPTSTSNDRSKSSSREYSGTSSSSTLSSKENSDLRGYKTTSDGKLTTYFNREVSEKDKALLGDSSPRKLESTSLQRSDSTSSSTSVSAWNAAGTWEERNYDDYAKQRIQNLLKVIKLNESGVSLSVDKVDNIHGDATVSLVRGKKRYIYDFSLDLHWQASINSEKYMGVLNVTDISADCDYVVSSL
jgi:activator of HSP90 ATPase